MSGRGVVAVLAGVGEESSSGRGRKSGRVGDRRGCGRVSPELHRDGIFSCLLDIRIFIV